MFPVRPPRPMPPRRPPLHGYHQYPNRPNFIAMFQDSNGNIDLEKISITAKQINGIYSQVSPLISQFIKR